MDPPRTSQRRLGFGTVVWALIPVLSVGLLAFLPFAHAAVKLQNRRMWLAPAAYAVVEAVVFGPLGSASNTGDLGAALVAALADRKLRDQARAIVAGDPALARELRIGRPDLPRRFEDGGLIDVNHVPKQILVERLGFSPTEAARVVETRDRLGGFSSAEEVCAFAEVPDTTFDALRERLLFLAAD